MTLSELQFNITADKIADVIKKITTQKAKPKGYESLTDILNELDVKKHKVFDSQFRPKKEIQNSAGEKDYQEVNRIALDLQNKIVNTAAQFVCGNAVDLQSTPTGDKETAMAAIIKKIWADNKLRYKSKNIAKLLFSETEVAELWYWDEAEEQYWEERSTPSAGKYKLRMKLLANSLGDTLYPVFDTTGDLIAFGRGYKTAMDNIAAASGGDGFNTHFDIYTADNIYRATSIDGGANYTVDAKKNGTGKIPVIYYRQDAPDWAKVQTLIDRFETLLSNHADTNDYFGNPTYVVDGTVEGFAKKGQTGQIIELSKGGKITVVSWDQAPESVKMELENLWKFIHTSTQTPDINFESIKGLGQLSGIALKMLFLDAHMKASDKEEIIGEGFQRRLNYLITAIAKIDRGLEPGTTLEITPKFTYFLPKDERGIVDMLNAAVTGGIMSKETAVSQNPLIEDAADEWAKIQNENSASNQLNDLMNSDLTGGTGSGAIIKPIQKKTG